VVEPLHDTRDATEILIDIADRCGFLDVWNGEHQLGPKDFLTGKVKSNSPLLLKDFVKAFQKSD